MDDYPKLRYGLEATPVEHEGRKMILINDRLGFSDTPLIMSQVAAGILALMTGESSLRDIQAHFMRSTGQMLYTEDLQEIVRKLDESLFLDNERFRETAGAHVARFHEEPVRPMQFAGKAYPAEESALRNTLDYFFTSEAGGPGLPFQTITDRRVLGIVVPHIDIKAGGPCFASAYKALSESLAPDTWVILGTGHEPVENHFALTMKHFETPFGVVQCNLEVAEMLARLAPRNIRASEYNHLQEHSVEFQAVFLARLQPGARIVPLLCSFSLEDAESDRQYIDEMARLMSDLPLTTQGSIGFMASVDFAHVGPRYGDRFQPSAFTIQEHLDADARLLELLARCDSDAFMQVLLRERNRRRICGMGPLYVLSRILEGKARGEVLQHTHARVDHQSSFVSFASMVFYDSSGGKATT